MLAPFASYALAAASQRYKFSAAQAAVGLLAALFIFRYLVPYAQYGRVFREESPQANIETSINLLSHLGFVREQYLESSADTYENRILGCYNTRPGIL